MIAVRRRADDRRQATGRRSPSGDGDAEQIVLVAILDQDPDDIAGFEPGCIAQMDLAVDFRRIGLRAAGGAAFAVDRVGAFRFEPVKGAAANGLPGIVPEEVKEERYARFMAKSAAISAAKLQAKIGRTVDAIIDAVDGEGGATGRSKADAPEIDGQVHLRDAPDVAPGDIVRVTVEDADEYDLFGAIA